ncbi:DNA primase [Candidatus Gottesmanbacteria bacterium RBG_16_52_11]|uniref:DNA primase n=1 Tax=Candidatus Gottesmanbacteria bacterium RBG_16_52_11 TaxID=1798374 RepID=A0A1F5YXC6_9BACT|nr:MAG: DNA primase [Candidatus Gottesmanbacteria bacterium RBG_16_52_11]
MSDIDDVKSRLNIVDIVGAKVPLKKAGRNFKGLCPFHSEKTPSFIVSPDRQTFHCFGCGKGGSVIDFVMEYDRVDFSEALETLAATAGVTLTHRIPDTPEGRIRQKIFEVNHLASEFYHYLMTKHDLGERARIYLKHRGVSDKTAKTFMLGYSPNGWEGLYRYLTKKGYAAELLEKAGLVIRSRSGRGMYDRFRGRIMFTLRDHRGNVVGFSGRMLDPDAKEAKYINTSETPVYIKGNVLYGLDVTKSAIQKENDCILTEGEFDVISSFQAGVANIVAVKGSALTDGHVALLRRFTERLTIAFDSDIAGDAASRRGIGIAEKAGLDIRVVVLPENQDPDEVVRANPGAFKKAVSAAVPIYDYFISSAVRRYDRTAAFGKKKISTELLPEIAGIENPIIQAHYVKQVARVLDVSEDVVNEGMRRLKKPVQPDRARESGSTTPEPVTHEERLEMYVLSLLVQTRTFDYLDELREAVAVSDFRIPAVRQIIEQLEKYQAEGTPFAIGRFTGMIPNELLSILDRAYLFDLSSVIDDAELVEREWSRALKELHKSVLKRKIRDTTARLREMPADEAGETAYLSLQQTVAELTNQLRTLEKPSVL